MKKNVQVQVCVWAGCERVFSSKQAMQRRHHSSVHLGEKHVCVWACCGEVFKRKRSMQRRHHSSVHLGEKHVCVWACCGEEFKRKQAMQRHHSSVHLGEKHVRQWPGCGEEFSSKRSMQRHHSSVHLGEKHVRQCPGCEVEFSSKRSMQRHHSSVHLGVARLNFIKTHLEAARMIDFSTLHVGGSVATANSCRCLVGVPAAETSTHLEAASDSALLVWSSRKLARSVQASWRLRCNGKLLQGPGRSANGRDAHTP